MRSAPNGVKGRPAFKRAGRWDMTPASAPALPALHLDHRRLTTHADAMTTPAHNILKHARRPNDE
jgi:hypothetical protein